MGRTLERNTDAAMPEENYEPMHPFEATQLLNFCPETVEEAKSLVPRCVFSLLQQQASRPRELMGTPLDGSACSSAMTMTGYKDGLLRSPTEGHSREILVIRLRLSRQQ